MSVRPKCPTCGGASYLHGLSNENYPEWWKCENGHFWEGALPGERSAAADAHVTGLAKAFVAYITRRESIIAFVVGELSGIALAVFALAGWWENIGK